MSRVVRVEMEEETRESRMMLGIEEYRPRMVREVRWKGREREEDMGAVKGDSRRRSVRPV